MSIDTMRSQRTTPVGAAQRRPSSMGAATVPPPEPGLPTIRVGFGDLASWEFTQRVAKGLASSSLVPEQYRLRIQDKKTKEWHDNPNAIPNCIIALNMADRIGADPLMVMQNLYIVEGRPSWSSQFVISAINSCKRFSSLQYQVTINGQKNVDYTVSEWTTDGTGRNTRVNRVVKTTVTDMVCVAWAIDKATGDRLEGPPVSMDMAVKEGWYGKNGSKWQTMPDLMIRYRAAAFFGRLYAPELLMGLRTVEETQDIIDAELNAEGVWEPADLGNDVAEPVASEVMDQETGEVTQDMPQVEHKPEMAMPPVETQRQPEPLEQPRVQEEPKRRAKPTAQPEPTAQEPEQRREPARELFQDQPGPDDDDGFGEAE